MSLRQTAKIIGVSASYLSQMINGRRPWNTEIKARYDALPANTFANTTPQNKGNDDYRLTPTTGTMVELGRFELPTSSMPLSPAPAVRLNPHPIKLLFLVTKMP